MPKCCSLCMGKPPLSLRMKRHKSNRSAVRVLSAAIKFKVQVKQEDETSRVEKRGRAETSGEDNEIFISVDLPTTDTSALPRINGGKDLISHKNMTLTAIRITATDTWMAAKITRDEVILIPHETSTMLGLKRWCSLVPL